MKVTKSTSKLSTAFADNLKRLRGSRTQAEMAAAVGKKKQQWTRWESPRANPTLSSMEAVARVFGVSVLELLLDNSNVSKPPQQTPHLISVLVSREEAMRLLSSVSSPVGPHDEALGHIVKGIVDSLEGTPGKQMPGS